MVADTVDEAVETGAVSVADDPEDAEETVEPFGQWAEDAEPNDEPDEESEATVAEWRAEQDAAPVSEAEPAPVLRATVKVSDFREAVSVVSRGISGRSTQPVQNNVYLEATDDGQLRLVATDLEFIAIEAFIPATEATPGAITLPGRLLNEVAANLPGEELTLTGELGERPSSRLFNGCGAGMGSGPTRLHLRGMEAADFEMLPPLPEGAVSLMLEQGLLHQVIEQTRVAVSGDETRPTLTGVLWDLRKHETRVVATDTHRLALREVPVIPDAGEPLAVIVPAIALAQVSALCNPGSESPVTVYLSENQVEFAGLGPNGNFVVGGRTVDGKFPDYEKVLPPGCLDTTGSLAEGGKRLTVPRKPLQEGLRRMLIVAREDANRVSLTFDENGLRLSADAADIGDMEEEVSATLEGEAGSVAVNARYLLDGLSGDNAEEVVIELTGALNPIALRGEGFVYVQMPMQK